MNGFRDQTAIVTGGASGIGRALGAALLRAGARVVLADVNRDAVEATATALAPLGEVRGVAVDVTDAAAVERVVVDTAAVHGRLDYLFNNAGIAIMGQARLMTLADWNALIDINLRGVVHGIAAAYPLMIRQGSGHIINTASAAGLAPTPGATGYAMTKHGIVGLSTSLRLEAAPFGVRVSVVCPGLIDTPIKQATLLLGADREKVLQDIPIKFYSADLCARDILHGVARNRAIIVVTPAAKIGWFLYRMTPRLLMRVVQSVAARSALLRGSD